MRKIVKYGMVGVASMAVSTLIFFLFSDLMGIAAWIVSLAFAPLNFLGRHAINKKWVYK